MLAYPKSHSFEERFLEYYCPLIIGCAERGKTSIPDTSDGIQIQLTIIAAHVCLNLNLLLSIPSVKRTMIVSQESIVEHVICFIEVLFYLAMTYFFSVKLNYLHLFIGQPGCFRHRQGKKYLMEFPFISCVGTLKNPISFSLV